MRPPGFWAAVRLVSFANVLIGEANWRTLWWSHEESVRVLEAFTGTERAGGGLQDSLPLWLELARCMRRYAMKRRVLDAWNVRGPRTSYEWPPARWPKRIEKRSRNSCALLIALQEKTRIRLAAICAEHRDEEPLLSELRRYRTPTRRLRYDPASRETALVDAREETLAAHLDGLLVNTLVAGLWDDIYQCPKCGKYGVKILHGERITRSCGSSRCRSQLNRDRRKDKRDALLKQIASETQRIRRLPVDEMHKALRRKFRLTRRELLKLLARLPERGPS